ncbi:MAG: TonB-dependent receptor [Bacteroidota bacterium]|nr:TonB-dependent receptor [Bacteroidota bacterium]
MGKKIIISIIFIATYFSVHSQIDTTVRIDFDTISYSQLKRIIIVTASLEKELPNEAPVPITIISAKMIRESSCNSFKEVLLTFVPGISSVQDHNEINIAMRGVYASSQQKILIMQDGHRLNSGIYSSQNPDYSISLDKIKQIEVLRGPASSLYGNIALTAVINIITKKGSQVVGTNSKIGMGNFGQLSISLVHGNSVGKNKSFLFWANLYSVDGEQIHIPQEQDYSEFPQSGEAYIGSINIPYSSDIGFKYCTEKIKIFANSGRGGYTEPFSAGGQTGEVYHRDLYKSFMGVSPGLSTESQHIGLTYTDDFRGINIKSNLYFDHYNSESLLIVSPVDTMSAALGWEEYNAGLLLSAKKKYASKLGTGVLITGIQAEGNKLNDSYFLSKEGMQGITIPSFAINGIMTPGREQNYSVFTQMKHNISKSIIFNSGLRYNFKSRFKSSNVSDWSPRLAMIYIPNKRINFKISYAESFVDAPYWYRHNRLNSYKGSIDLLPENLNSFQIGSAFNFLNNKLTFHLNGFYNKLTDVIYRVPGATGDAPRYKNAGMLNSHGIENELKFISPSVKIYANLTCLYVSSYQDYGVTNNTVNNVPAIFGNISANFYPIRAIKNRFTINFTAQYTGEQYSPITTKFLGGVIYENLNFKIPPKVLYNSAVRYQTKSGILLKASISNILNTKYTQGGSVEFPYPQKGRWYLFTLGRFLKN